MNKMGLDTCSSRGITLTFYGSGATTINVERLFEPASFSVRPYMTRVSEMFVLREHHKLLGDI